MQSYHHQPRLQLIRESFSNHHLMGLSSLPTRPIRKQRPPSSLENEIRSDVHENGRTLRGCSRVSEEVANKPFFAKPPSSTCSFVQSDNWISHRTVLSISQRATKRIECTNNAVEAVDVASNEDLTSGVRRKKLAVFVSGGGSNFRSIHEASLRGSIHGDIVVLVTNKHGCGGALYAREKGIPVILFPKTKDEPDGLSTASLVATLRRFEVDFILLAGYLKLIPVELIRAYAKSIVNIHPSLLPAFGGKGYYGMKVHKAVIASGARFSGPTIHFVDEHYDTGRILAQSVVLVLPNDTAENLAARVLGEEHRLYVDAVAAICEERIIWRQDGVPLIQSKENPNEYS